MHSSMNKWQSLILWSFVYVMSFTSCTDCRFDHERTVGRPGQCCNQSSSWQWNYCLCSGWVWKLLLWILSTSPLQQPFRCYPSSARLSAVFAVRNSCPVHLNSLDSVWVLVCRSLVLSALMHVYVYISMCVGITDWSTFCAVYVKAPFLIVLHQLSPCLWMHTTAHHQVYVHVQHLALFPSTHRHKHTSPWLTPYSLQQCNNYCSLANGVLIAVIFH